MFDGRFHLNSSPLGTILNLLCNISFSDSVDKHDDELDGKEDEEGDLCLFSCLDLGFHLFLLEHFTISGLDEGEFIFFFLVLCYLCCFLVEEISRCSDTLFAGWSYELSPLYHFLPCLITEVNYRGNNICIMLICMQRLSIFETFWHYLMYGIYIIR